MQNVVSVQHLGDLRLRIRFDDGVEGELDFAKFLKFRGVLAPLRDPTYFAKVFVHPEAGTVSWPNGVDLDTLVLYARITRRSIQSLLAADAAPRRRTKSSPRPPRRRTATPASAR